MGVKIGVGVDGKSLLTVPPVIRCVNKCDDMSTLVLTHQQVELVQVGHDDCSREVGRTWALDPEPCHIPLTGLTGPETKEVTQCDKGQVWRQ